MTTSILIYEDNANLRESISELISYAATLQLLDACADVNDVEANVKELKPDVILMDIDMPGRNGIEAVKLIRKFNSRVHIIMLTVFEDNEHVYDAICAGASGYLLKKHISDKLLVAIQEVMNGEAPMSPGIARIIIKRLQLNQQGAQDYNLTTREKEILSILSRGSSYKMISAELFISIDTVRTHIKHIYEKLQVHSQAEAISKALNEKLV